ncbi:hypothetical protein AVEN_231068-1 [Araneus ventricosus]|uniref:Uncharacterized protein n=1 Tax=Araneus ventricosus TaxID=182803 RepID=A0A4Y2A441_ARAVE|nr:hypothetical protein AVEN_231068-1 [Araneus ventricosus]
MTRTPELAPPSTNFRTTPADGRLATKYDLACNMTDLQRNLFQNLKALRLLTTRPPWPHISIDCLHYGDMNFLFLKRD